jgi:hypothetical protein
VSRQINHLIVSFLLVIRRVWYAVLLVVCVVELAATELWEHMFKTDPIKPYAAHLDFQDLS